MSTKGQGLVVMVVVEVIVVAAVVVAVEIMHTSDCTKSALFVGSIPLASNTQAISRIECRSVAGSCDQKRDVKNKLMYGLCRQQNSSRY
jgi:hypothetical protein